jgi:cysteine-rich repeat protein
MMQRERRCYGTVRSGLARGTLVAIAAVAFAAASAGAADHGARGSSLLLKDGTRKKITVQSKDGADLPAPATSPVAAGATLDVTLIDSQGVQMETLTLPASGWKASGTALKYKGAKGTPISSATLIGGKLLKITGAPVTLTLADAPAVRAAVALTIGGDRYCLDFAPVANPNTTLIAKWGLQAVAGVCPIVPTTTTTTTLPTGPCGNGTLDQGEACDDGNSVDCDGCDSNCTLSGTCGNGITCAPEQCDGGPDCTADCESTASTCGTAIGQRLAIISIDTPEPLAGAQINLEYPQFQTSIPGSGNSSAVNGRVFFFTQGGQHIVNDRDTDMTIVLANTSAFVNAGPVLAVNFDECTDISRNICNRVQTVTDCCSNPADPNQFPNTCGGFTSPTIACDVDEDCPILTSANDADCTAANAPYSCCTGAGTGTCSPSSFCLGASNPAACCTGSKTGTCTAADVGGRCTFRCPGNPPVCAPGNFPTTVPSGPCTNVAGACPGDNVCVSQMSQTACTVSDPVKFEGGQAVPVPGVTCTVTIL